jgi:glycosyltransferase involved in cell wall biosynthesis
VYLGAIEYARGVGLLVEAVSRLTAMRHLGHLRLIGDGRDLERFRERARRLEVLDREVESTTCPPDGVLAKDSGHRDRETCLAIPTFPD